MDTREAMPVLAVVTLVGETDTDAIGAVLGRTAADVDAALAALRTRGDIDAHGFPSDSARASLALCGENRLATICAEVLEYFLERDTLTESTARNLARAGTRDPRLVDFLCARAELADPGVAADLYANAVTAGAHGTVITVRHAEACALSGDFDTAASLADSVIENSAATGSATDISANELADAVRISASAAAFCGNSDRSAQLYEWLGPERTAADASVAATVFVTAGNLDAAEQWTVAAASAAPTAANAGTALLARGLVQSVTSPGPAALNTLTRSLTVHGARSRILPDSAVAITALAALHCGDAAHAGSVLERALQQGDPLDPHRPRLSLLTAWTAMSRGDLLQAKALLDTVDDSSCGQRDLLFVHALRVGLARRGGEYPDLLQAWSDARSVIAEYSVDLLSLLPLGELWLAAVRVGDAPLIAHLVDQAGDLLRALGDPALWGSAFHWYGVQAAILAETPADLVPHARALGEAAESSRYADALAGAGRAWLRVLQGDTPDPDQVAEAARNLARIGLPWDGARLAGEAALRAADTGSATSLLQVARELRHPTAAATTTETATRATSAGDVLTDREREVAELLTLGLTYREIGSRLYISAKTVEHHVARIRRRLGAESRSELLAMLRATGYGRQHADRPL
ncbi:MAG: helix-turn-helix transcriptional regulator [Rhodococcus sp.]|nr:helix-turn-helix transcriptional regulator [Rhodococcus sp. (in: high G+C Gram-positive bacteria)]